MKRYFSLILAIAATVSAQIVPSTGNVRGPTSATDNAVARYDGTTGKLIQDSGVTIDDNGNLTAAGDIVFATNNTFLKGKTSGGSSVNLLALTSDSLTRFIAGVDAGGFQWTNQAQTVAWASLNSSALSVAGNLTVNGGSANFNHTASAFSLNFQGSGATFATVTAISSTGELKTNMGPSAGWGGYQTWATDGTTRMTLSNGGNLGIGTTNPATKLVISNATNGKGIEFSPNVGGTSGMMEAYDRTGNAYTPMRYLASSHSFEQGDATFAGKSITFNASGVTTESKRQSLTGSITAAASTVSKKIVYTGPTHSLDVAILAVQDGTVAHSAAWNGKITTAYGATSSGSPSSAVVGNITNIAVAYDNGGSPGYTINVTLTYTGNAPEIHYTIDGHSMNTLAAQ
jgi:hypothetical protein